MSEVSRLHGSQGTSAPCYAAEDTDEASPTTTQLHSVKSPYGNYGDRPVGYNTSEECEELDPPFSSTEHQKAMVAALEVIGLIITLGSKLRKSMRMTKKMESLQQIGKLLEAADKMRQAAVFALVSGIVQGGTSALGGGLELGGAFKGMASLKKTVGGIDWKKFDNNSVYRNDITKRLTKQMGAVTQELRTVNKKKADRHKKEAAQRSIDQHVVQHQQIISSKMDQENMLYRGLSQLLQSMGQIAGGTFTFCEKNAEADAQTLQAEATAEEHKRQETSDLDKEIAELVSCALQVLKALITPKDSG